MRRLQSDGNILNSHRVWGDKDVRIVCKTQQLMYLRFEIPYTNFAFTKEHLILVSDMHAEVFRDQVY